MLMVEVAIAIGLLAIIASSVFVYLGTQLMSANVSHKEIDALRTAQEGLEATRAIRDLGWSGLTTGSHGLSYAGNVWSFSGTSDTWDGISRTITVTDVSTDEKRIASTASWTTPWGRSLSVSLTTNVTNWRSVSAPRLTGNWGNPQTLGTIDLGPGVQATGINVRSGYAYMSGTASSAAKKDLFIINVSNGASPSLTSSIDTGPGANAIAVTSTFALLANSDVTAQLQIANISSTSSPYVVASFHLTGNASQALSVAATGSLALVGTANDSGPELFIVDITNPSIPVLKGSLEVGGDVNRIAIRGNRAFLATASSTKELQVVDISNPTSPVRTASYDLAGSNAALGLYVNYQDERAYVSRATAVGTSPELAIFDVSHPDAPSLLGTMEYGNDIGAVFAADSLLFTGTSNSNLEFQIYNISTPSAPSYYTGLNFPQVANDIAFENNVVYVAVRSNDALRIITSQ